MWDHLIHIIQNSLKSQSFNRSCIYGGDPSTINSDCGSSSSFRYTLKGSSMSSALTLSSPFLSTHKTSQTLELSKSCKLATWIRPSGPLVSLQHYTLTLLDFIFPELPKRFHINPNLINYPQHHAPNNRSLKVPESQSPRHITNHFG